MAKKINELDLPGAMPANLQPSGTTAAETEVETYETDDESTEEVPQNLEEWGNYLISAGIDAHFEAGVLYIFVPAIVGDESDIPQDGPIGELNNGVGGVEWTLKIIDNNQVWAAALVDEAHEEPVEEPVEEEPVEEPSEEEPPGDVPTADGREVR